MCYVNGIEFLVVNQKTCSRSSSRNSNPIVNSPKSHGIANASTSVILQMVSKRTAQSMVGGPRLAHVQKLVAAELRAELAATPRLPNLAKIA